jgi:hypothetical protein
MILPQWHTVERHFDVVCTPRSVTHKQAAQFSDLSTCNKQQVRTYRIPARAQDLCGVCCTKERQDTPARARELCGVCRDGKRVQRLLCCMQVRFGELDFLLYNQSNLFGKMQWRCLACGTWSGSCSRHACGLHPVGSCLQTSDACRVVIGSLSSVPDALRDPLPPNARVGRS